ncbi:heme NO-binding domain-containing protein [Sulfitobacter sp. F26204]|uniref:heme NO-binding domain-containing protein n=1 Tax=Sulfitobacter sp. F26204 TaxID=2996014 RepID=UPI00225DD2EF|nr:heme NO-binding domain-containing protein [Sulfitobacter sp. F26204]MCX7559217.1 heme NO-binding domain-containing protein [Sulfitobacter sp. F26204]
MHGLVNRGIQLFVTHTYGRSTWLQVTIKAGLDFTDFEGMLRYSQVYTPQLLEASADVLKRPQDEIMEDFGAFLVCHPGFEAVRRLLRFSGVDFVDFLHSLDDLHDRVRLAVSDLILPKVELRANADGHYNLVCEAGVQGYGHVMMGILRAMADDYGALAFLEHSYSNDGTGTEIVSITLVENDFAEGRAFSLAVGLG